jgi:hypothetical protein
MNKKGAWFNVIKSGRVVDCIKAADIGIAVQVAMDKWERFLGRDGTLSVVPVPAKSTKLVQPATRSEVARYAGWPYDNTQSFNYWTRPNIAAQGK